MRASSISGLSLLLGSLSAYSAEPYKFQLNSTFTTGDSDSTSYTLFNGEDFTTISDLSVERLSISGEYFFRSIDMNEGPLKEAAFLARSPALAFSISETKTKGEFRGGIFNTPAGEALPLAGFSDFWVRDYSVRYRFASPDTPWIGSVGYNYSDSSAFIPGDRNDGYTVGFGRYFGPRTSLVAEYQRSHLDPASFESFRGETLTIGARSLLQIGTQRHLALNASLSSSQGEWDGSVGTYTLGATYYPRNDISISLATSGEYHNSITPGDVESNSYVLSADWFITDSIELGFAYELSDQASRHETRSNDTFSRFDSDSDGFRINFSWRH